MDYDTSSNDWADKCPLTRNRRGVGHIGERVNHRRNISAPTHFRAVHRKGREGEKQGQLKSPHSRNQLANVTAFTLINPH